MVHPPAAAPPAAELLVSPLSPAPYAQLYGLFLPIDATRLGLGVHRPCPPAAAVIPPLLLKGRPVRRCRTSSTSIRAMAGRPTPDPVHSRRRCTGRAGGTSLYHFAAILPRTGPVRGQSRPEDLILPPAPRWGGVVITSLYRFALVAPGSPPFGRSFTPPPLRSVSVHSLPLSGRPSAPTATLSRSGRGGASCRRCAGIPARAKAFLAGLLP